ERIATAILFEVPMDNIIRYALDLGVNAINPCYNLVTNELMQKAHSAGLKVYPWTVNDVKTMKQLLALGVDGLITDFPDKALELMNE
ncbi:MAG: glycerophosphodiester phosphodiesterase, partial [Promethearchaeota archaeon]